MNQIISIDNGGRRSGLPRRVFSYVLHFPERRLRMDRRSGDDRRAKRYKEAKVKFRRRIE